MAFDSRALQLIQRNRRGIPDRYAYSNTSDTIADISAANYFPSGVMTVADPVTGVNDIADPSFVLIDVSAADGIYQVKYDVVSGVVGVVGAAKSAHRVMSKLHSDSTNRTAHIQTIR